MSIAKNTGLMTPTKMWINWTDLQLGVTSLYNRILKRNAHLDSFDFIVPIPRGGYCIATILSHMSGLDIVTLDQLGQPWTYEKIWQHSKLLFVDDIIDTGKTLKTVKPYVKKNDLFCALYSKTWTPKINKNVLVCHVTQNWIIFPWEVNNEGL